METDSLFGTKSSTSLGDFSAIRSSNCCVSSCPKSSSALFLRIEFMCVAIAVAGSTTVYPEVFAKSLCDLSIQYASSPKAGSFVLDPSNGIEMPPGLIASSLPIITSPAPLTAPLITILYPFGVNSRLSLIRIGCIRNPSSDDNFFRMPLILASNVPPPVGFTNGINP